ncbi:hypothetical protein Sjap_017703 [Stephania japonica]|uniref:Uncharacterized protein n=1 Tax=Stephania japonica TaxID=461633 RepID=A0AAP0NJS4_9MAGN
MVSICPTFGGSDPGFRAEVIHSMNEKLSLICGCSCTSHPSAFESVFVVYGDVYMLDDEMKWKVLPPMPEPDSHIEFAWAVINNYVMLIAEMVNFSYSQHRLVG